MKTNIRVKKKCEYCKEEFVAKTTKTRYCSHKCNQRGYKQNQKQNKIATTEKATSLDIINIDELNRKDFLTAKEAAYILSMSLRTVYRLIQSKELNAYNFSERKTLIRRKDIDMYFDLSLNDINIDKSHLKELINLENSYTIDEIQKKYNISSGALYNLIKRLEIQKKQVGKHVLVRKEDIDKIFAS
ncbi:MAG: helix-turn-helix domain-containing protein [Flavobacterium sp.]|jgi:excisionase family DNA binding protein|nr:helix-turn-helix domain-containing protein [Flavobacterium sp.]